MPVPLLIELVLVIGGRCLSPTYVTGFEPTTPALWPRSTIELHAFTNPKTNSIKMAD